MLDLDTLTDSKEPLTYAEFLHTTSVLKMLYGGDRARKYFTDNIVSYYNTNSESIQKLETESETP